MEWLTVVGFYMVIPISYIFVAFKFTMMITTQIQQVGKKIATVIGCTVFFIVSGHSLGGHLVSAFTYLFPVVVDRVEV